MENKSENTGKKKKQKPKFVDDGRTVYSMENVPSRTGKTGKSDGIDVTRKERRAMRRAAILYYLPRLGIAIACFTLTAVLMWLWLK